jgi:hypothetical protein
MASLLARERARQQRNAAAGLVPFSSYYGMREFMQALGGNSHTSGAVGSKFATKSIRRAST